MQTSGDQAPIPQRRPSPPRQTSTTRNIAGDADNLQVAADGVPDGKLSPEALDGQKTPQPFFNADIAVRPREEPPFVPKPTTGDHHKPRVSKHHKKEKGKEASSDLKRTKSVSNPNFGECANDAIGIRKDAKVAKDVADANIAAASLAAFEESVANNSNAGR